MFRTLFCFSVLVASVSSLTGCASIAGSNMQSLSVVSACNANPVNDANCTITNDKGTWFVKSPGSVTIHKAYGDVTVQCQKADMKGSGTFKSEWERILWGNILFGGLPGWAVDASNGAGFSYPTTLAVNMSGNCEGEKKDQPAPIPVAPPVPPQVAPAPAK